ncbi:MAG: hypothetical protein DMG06_05675, partial [Acidobacteria bacterium]
PTVSITGPSNGAAFTAPADITITADASDTDGSISQVDFYQGTTLLGSDNSFPYSFAWNSVAAGSYTLTAKATDDKGIPTSSSPVNVTVNAGGGSLPPPWADLDLGAVGAAGSASSAGGTFTVSGSGADIWNTADAFHYVYQPLTGDGQIVARVASLQNTDAWAKVGVMIRETLTANSRHAMMTLTSANGLAFMRRLSTAGTTTRSALTAGAAPYWVKLVRTGNTFSGYRSSDGINWVLVGSDTLPMTATVYIGLAVTAHNNTLLNTSTFDNISGP